MGAVEFTIFYLRFSIHYLWLGPNSGRWAYNAIHRLLSVYPNLANSLTLSANPEYTDSELAVNSKLHEN